jgi:hypothetical protein
MLAHFGCKTSNFRGFGSELDRHEEMFAGPKEQWLDNVIQLWSNLTDQEKDDLRFLPVKFQYR